MYLSERKIKIPTVIFISEVINIDFWQIWHFDAKVTGKVGTFL